MKMTRNSNLLHILGLLGLALELITAECSKAQSLGLSVTTLLAGDLSPSSATLNGTVDPGVF